MTWDRNAIVIAIIHMVIVGAAYFVVLDPPRDPARGTPFYNASPLPAQQFDYTRDPETNLLQSVNFSAGNNRYLVLYTLYPTASPVTSDKSLANVRNSLRRLFDSPLLPAAGTKRILVRGHSDIRRMSADVDQVNLCTGKMLERSWYQLASPPVKDPTSNDCLSLLRAYYVASAIVEGGMRVPGEPMQIGYDSDPFMSGTDSMVDGNLYRFGRLRQVAEALKSELHVPEQYVNADADRFPEIQRAVLRANDIEERLMPFRSVVVMVQQCQTTQCPEAWRSAP